jgi:2OG-Fe(II) oxygenase superfamily
MMSAVQHFIIKVLLSSNIQPQIQNMHVCWQHFVNKLASRDYVEWLGNIMEVETANLKVDAALCIYDSNCYLEPHTDRDHRVLSQIIYFNKQWRAESGGSLRLLRSEDPVDIAYEILLVLNTSVVFRRVLFLRQIFNDTYCVYSFDGGFACYNLSSQFCWHRIMIFRFTSLISKK